MLWIFWSVSPCPPPSLLVLLPLLSSPFPSVNIGLSSTSLDFQQVIWNQCIWINTEQMKSVLKQTPLLRNLVHQDLWNFFYKYSFIPKSLINHNIPILDNEKNKEWECWIRWSRSLSDKIGIWTYICWISVFTKFVFNVNFLCVLLTFIHTGRKVRHCKKKSFSMGYNKLWVGRGVPISWTSSWTEHIIRHDRCESW